MTRSLPGGNSRHIFLLAPVDYPASFIDSIRLCSVNCLLRSAQLCELMSFFSSLVQIWFWRSISQAGIPPRSPTLIFNLVQAGAERQFEACVVARFVNGCGNFPR